MALKKTAVMKLFPLLKVQNKNPEKKNIITSTKVGSIKDLMPHAYLRNFSHICLSDTPCYNKELYNFSLGTQYFTLLELMKISNCSTQRISSGPITVPFSSSGLP